MEKSVLKLDKATPVFEKKEKKSIHTPSTIQADTLFTFTTKLEYIVAPLKTKILYSRFVEEDISYLKIPKIKKVGIPMKCFCDINLHRIGIHLYWYGYYGLAFSKEWGMKNKIQPIQYINPNSYLCKDFSTAFSAAIKADIEKESKEQVLLKNYLIHELMYYKPYQGKIKNRNKNSDKKELKCFADECEWRYIPDLSATDIEQIYFEDQMVSKTNLDLLSDSISDVPETGLHFEYEDIKYIIVENNSDFIELTNVIDNLDLKNNEKNLLISKILIWESSKGDF